MKPDTTQPREQASDPVAEIQRLVAANDELRAINERLRAEAFNRQAAPEAPASEQPLIELESTVAAARADAALFNDEALRLRRVVRALGMESEVPDDAETLRGCLFSVLGQIARKLESRAAQAPHAGADTEIVAAVRKLVKAKGRFHTEQNYKALTDALSKYDAAMSAATEQGETNAT